MRPKHAKKIEVERGRKLSLSLDSARGPATRLHYRFSSRALRYSPLPGPSCVLLCAGSCRIVRSSQVGNGFKSPTLLFANRISLRLLPVGIDVSTSLRPSNRYVCDLLLTCAFVRFFGGPSTLKAKVKVGADFNRFASEKMEVLFETK